MKLFALQLDIQWEAKQENFARARQHLTAAAVSPGSLVVLPEMFATGFSFNLSVTRQGSPPECEAFLAQLATELQATVAGGVVASTAPEDERVQNQCVVFDPRGVLLARFAKLHPFTPGGEGAVHRPGETIVLFPWQGFQVAPLVCYDLRFPEAFRQAVNQGATLFLVIANWPARRERHWVTLLQARAIENQAYVLGVNRCGRDPQASYSGRSLVVDPKGIVIADAGEEETCLSVDVDPAVVQRWRQEFPALDDQRTVRRKP